MTNCTMLLKIWLALCEEMSTYFRNMMLIKTMKDARAFIPVSEEEFQSLTKQALSLSLTAILHGLDTIQDALEKYTVVQTQELHLK